MAVPRFPLRAVAILASTVMAAHAPPEPFMAIQAQENAETRARLLGLVKANNAFGFDLHARLRRAPGNTFLSPFSLSTALAMTADGARGETARQMASVLRFPFGQDRLNAAFASLIRSVRPGDEDAARGEQLRTANALWGQRGYQFLPEFVATLRGPFEATFDELDFRHAVEEARSTINTWAEDKTRGKIQDLIAPGFLDSSTRLVLTNAVYFKGSWSQPFHTERTQDEDFHLDADKTVRVP